jgi:uncharacterized membrane protein YfcA
MEDSSRQILGYLCIVLACSFASSAGIGGGGLLCPIYLVVFNYDFDKAVILSLTTVFGNVLSQVCVNSRATHPLLSTRSLIDWGTILTLLPLEMAGANLGVILSPIFPSGLLVIVAMILLIVAGVKIGMKGVYLWQEETAVQRSQTAVDSSLSEKLLLQPAPGTTTNHNKDGNGNVRDADYLKTLLYQSSVGMYI